MAQVAGKPDDRSGLRERKKSETRARLIDAAIDLVEKQGYAQTTVDQIAQAVDVSPRTVAHYFPSKDQLLLSVVDVYADAVSDQLIAASADLSPLEALYSANVAVLDNARQQATSAGELRITSLLRTLHVSPTLVPMARAIRSPRMCAELAERMGTHPDDRQVELVLAVWSAVISVAWSGLNDRWAAEPDPTFQTLLQLLRDGLRRGFDEFAGLVGELAV
jgi:AcrR family transcriptional regulator